MKREAAATRWRNLSVFKIRKRLKHILYSKLYRDVEGDISRSILVAGAGRSGTTWLATIISSQVPCRIMFEPFCTERIKEFAGFNHFQYVRPSSEYPALLSYCRRVFTGDIRNPWIDRKVDRIHSSHRLIKAIRANLFLKWIHESFPDLPILFIIRHPCAVVLSRMRMGWETEKDLNGFLTQSLLVDDVLAGKTHVLESAETSEERHALIWCISNWVPLKQFATGEWNLVFYENLCLQPHEELPRIFGAIGQRCTESALQSVSKPSTTAIRGSAVFTGDDKVLRWRKELSAGQIQRIVRVVRDFGLGHIYDQEPTPKWNPAERPDRF